MAKANNEKEKKNKHFFKDLKAELKKVIWPTPKQIVNNTIAVITIVLITAIIVLGLDLTFKALNTYGVEKLKDVVVNTTSKDNESNSADNSTDDKTNTAEENNTNNDVQNNAENTNTVDGNDVENNATQEN